MGDSYWQGFQRSLKAAVHKAHWKSAAVGCLNSNAIWTHFYFIYFSTLNVVDHGSQTLLGCWCCVAQWLLPFSKCGPACWTQACIHLLRASGAPFMWNFSLFGLCDATRRSGLSPVWIFMSQDVSDTDLYFAFQLSIPEVLSASQLFAAGRAAIFCGCVWCQKMEMLLKWKQLVATALSAGGGF